MTGNPYTQDMSTSNVAPIRDAAHELRRARGQFVKDMIDRDGRSARYVALNVGLNPTSMGERLKGKSPFLADELENIARVLKIEPVSFYAQYIGVHPDDSNPRTLVPKVAGSTPVGGTVIQLPTRERSTVERSGLAPVIPFTGRAS